MHVIDFLDAIAKLEPGLRSFLQANLRHHKYDEGAILVREGEVAGTIGFIEEGLIRGFRTRKEEREFTSWFMREGDVCVSVRSFFKQVPASETVQTLEPCIIRSLT